MHLLKLRKEFLKYFKGSDKISICFILSLGFFSTNDCNVFFIFNLKCYLIGVCTPTIISKSIVTN